MSYRTAGLVQTSVVTQTTLLRLNAMAADMALLLAPLSLDVRAAHVWTQRNCVCDALSRLEGDDLSRPAILKDAARTKLERPKCTILRSLMPQTPNLAMSI